jgi:multidrug efflux pump subunit AcrB
VSLVGTFLFMSAFGFSLNNLSLFGLVLAIGIVVDDAIVVVENIERNLEAGMSAREAAHRTMDEVGTALVSIALVLCAVFIPTAFLGGISGQFFQQFAMTIAVATVISAFNSLTLSPALGAILLRARHEDAGSRSPMARFFAAFNRGFERTSKAYGRAVCGVTGRPMIAVGVFVALIVATLWMVQRVPGGFIPEQDQGYLVVAVELPKGASLARTDAVLQEATGIILDTPGAARAIAFAGFSGATFSNASNAGAIFVPLKPFAERGPDDSSGAVLQRLSQRLSVLREAQVFVVSPPPVRGLGNAGGFKMMVQDRSGRGLAALEGATWGLAMPANQGPETTRVFTTFSNATPRYFLDIDRTRAEMLKVPVENIFETLSVYLGSSYVNDFNLFGRSYRVTAQADAQFRREPAQLPGRQAARARTVQAAPAVR